LQHIAFLNFQLAFVTTKTRVAQCSHESGNLIRKQTSKEKCGSEGALVGRVNYVSWLSNWFLALATSCSGNLIRS